MAAQSSAAKGDGFWGGRRKGPNRAHLRTSWQSAEHIPDTTGSRGEKGDACPAKQVWSDGQASHSCLCFLLFSFIMPFTASRLSGMDPPASGSTHQVHSPAPWDGSTYLQAHSPSLEPFGSYVCLCPSHVSLSNRSQLSLCSKQLCFL